MYKLFFTNKCAFPNTDDAITYVLKEFFQLTDVRISRTENGKPYLIGQSIYLSITHTTEKLFLIFSDENIGIDAEPTSRQVHFSTILKKFSKEEQSEITSNQLFLKHWTAKEAVIKWLGGTISKCFYQLKFIGNKMYYGSIELPIQFHFCEIDTHLLCICGEHLDSIQEGIPF